jgi:hypothetical protein
LRQGSAFSRSHALMRVADRTGRTR